MNNEEGSQRKEDQSDAQNLGHTKPLKDRPDATMPVSRSSENYNMTHKKRGMAVILAYSEFAAKEPPPREGAPHDVRRCKTAFEKLGYVASVHWNLPKKDFLDRLDKVRMENHEESDSLVIIFMSHGGINRRTNIEYLETYDERVNTNELWKNFTPEKCPTLAGKPKMFFIQACRGDETDKGVKLLNMNSLSVQTDSIQINAAEEEVEYAIPLYADMLMMWASYPGTFAFKAHRDGINGSVFLHYLTEVLDQYAKKEDLASMLTRVTREVAIRYEVWNPNNTDRDHGKQIPQTVSTLMRRVHFSEKADGGK